MSYLLTYFRDAKRMFRTPDAALIIVLLIILGIGGVTAIFNLTYASLVVPLPFPQPEQLVRIGGEIRMFNIYTSSFEREDALGRIFSNYAAYIPSISRDRINFPGMDTYKEVHSLLVTRDFFEVLGIQPYAGSGFSRNENVSGAIISYRLWRNEMMHADDVIGKQIFLGARSITIAGIMPEGFNFPSDTDVWLCRSGSVWELTNNTQYIGRLGNGMSIGKAVSDLKAINFNPVPGIIGSDGPVLQSLQTFLYGDQYPLLDLFGVVAVLFLILVCAGVMNLLIAQSATRKQEIALRLIFGASRQNLVFQLIREILPLVVIGGLAGWWFSEIISKWLWVQFPALQNSTVNTPVKIAFMAFTILIVTIICGLIPSLQATGLNLNTYLKSASDDKRRFFSSREVLVGLQFSITLALLISVGVLLRSMMFRVDFPIGWSSSQEVAVVSTYPNGTVPVEFDNIARRARSFQDVKRELSMMPEVVTVGYLTIPFSSESIRINQVPIPTLKALPPRGQEWPPGTPAFTYALADPNGFKILGIPLIAGRYFTDDDVANRLELMTVPGYGRAGGVAIINQACAQSLWPEENALGKILYDASSAYFEVVGVVQNYHQVPGNNDFFPTVYTPMTGASTSYQLLAKLRPGVSLMDFQSNARNRLSGFTMAPAVFEVHALSEYIKDVMISRRLTLQLLSCFTILGVIISGLSIYATAALMVAARNREMGIRIALGAQTWDILLLALWIGLRATILGLPLGLLFSWILSKVLSSFLIQANVNDPLAWGVSCAVLLGITLIAVLIPAVRATRVNPLDILRNK